MARGVAPGKEAKALRIHWALRSNRTYGVLSISASASGRRPSSGTARNEFWRRAHPTHPENLGERALTHHLRSAVDVLATLKPRQYDPHRIP